MSVPSRVLVVGGYGVFGERVCRLLAGSSSSLSVVIGGRDGNKCKHLANELRTEWSEFHVTDDPNTTATSSNWHSRLLTLRPTVVIDAAGPFQTRSRSLARACVQAGAHYIDLADDRHYVSGVADDKQLDNDARTANVLVASGASSVPALSSAVIEQLIQGAKRIEAIDIGICAGNRAPRGLATVKSIVSMVGQPLSCWDGGRWINRYGWQDLRRRSLTAGGGRHNTSVHQQHTYTYTRVSTKNCSRLSVCLSVLACI